MSDNVFYIALIRVVWVYVCVKKKCYIIDIFLSKHIDYSLLLVFLPPSVKLIKAYQTPFYIMNNVNNCITISNGVRQGGIFSPVLFSTYMVDLSVLLSQIGIGCHIDDLCINHAFHADDLCLMAPCAIALQELLIYVMSAVLEYM